jgi:4-phospho-D-threonate 3-dehydrogenase / 4-phospho-D-erythronate 3-dehydrogenase
MSKIKIGITIGDVNGIGPEVILKALFNKKMLDLLTPVIYGSSKVLAYHKNIITPDNIMFNNVPSAEKAQDGQINVVNCWQDTININLGKVSEVAGKCAKLAIDGALVDLKAGYIDALVTAPINKKAMDMAGFDAPGHTEYISKNLGGAESLMMLVSENMRVGLITGHIPLSQVTQKITKSLVQKKIQIMYDTLRMDFGIDNPLIAVLALNPHAGDEGLMGDEDTKIVRPAIEEMKQKGILAMGPYPADGFFGSSQYKKFHGVLAMYHDQGLIPFKGFSFSEGVNFTAGLPFVRTSPDHGTAFDIAGANEADPNSMIHALFGALDIVRQRYTYQKNHSNSISKKSKQVIAQEDESIEGLAE